MVRVKGKTFSGERSLTTANFMRLFNDREEGAQLFLVEAFVECKLHCVVVEIEQDRGWRVIIQIAQLELVGQDTEKLNKSRGKNIMTPEQQTKLHETGAKQEFHYAIG